MPIQHLPGAIDAAASERLTRVMQSPPSNRIRVARPDRPRWCDRGRLRDPSGERVRDGRNAPDERFRVGALAGVAVVGRRPCGGMVRSPTPVPLRVRRLAGASRGAIAGWLQNGRTVRENGVGGPSVDPAFANPVIA